MLPNYSSDVASQDERKKVLFQKSPLVSSHPVILRTRVSIYSKKHTRQPFIKPHTAAECFLSPVLRFETEVWKIVSPVGKVKYRTKKPSKSPRGKKGHAKTPTTTNTQKEKKTTSLLFVFFVCKKKCFWSSVCKKGVPIEAVQQNRFYHHQYYCHTHNKREPNLKHGHVPYVFNRIQWHSGLKKLCWNLFFEKK